MQPGLFRLGTDFGNGPADSLAFPPDAQLEHYVSEKARVLGAHPERAGSVVTTEAETRAVAQVEDTLRGWLTREGHPAAGAESLDAIARSLAEDVVIVHAASREDRAVWLQVCFPSGWRPELIVGQSFSAIHARIPAFGAVARAAPSLVDAMVTRGPYVRFVWTISADDALDHHPDHGQREPWRAGLARAFLRVERQTMLPVPEARAALFAIRTYHYEFAQLSRAERQILTLALSEMPAEIRRYKGLESAIEPALELLARAPGG